MTQSEWRKCIVCGLPMEFREAKNGGGILRGFWSYPYLWVIAPIEAMFVSEFKIMLYEGSYIAALAQWMFGEME